MNTRALFFIAMLCTAIAANAQTGNGREYVNKLCGCFEVEFKYAETFSPDKNYKFHEREVTSGVIELALPIEMSNDKIVIQHLLVISDSVIVKHWREDWTYQSLVMWNYTEGHTWNKQPLNSGKVKGRWLQTVWEVSDAPRYQGYSQFVELDDKIIWQSTADAPLPRREYTVRSDYNILRRTNRLNITDSGYIHEQDNRKILRSNGTDKLLAEEKGLNTYTRVADSKCEAARRYWEKNKTYWEKVRKEWAVYLDAHNSISLKTTVDGKPLHNYLNTIMKEYAANQLNKTETETKIKSIIEKFIGRGDKSVAQQ